MATLIDELIQSVFALLAVVPALDPHPTRVVAVVVLLKVLRLLGDLRIMLCRGSTGGLRIAID